VSENNDRPLTIIQLAKKLIEAGLAPFLLLLYNDSVVLRTNGDE